VADGLTQSAKGRAKAAKKLLKATKRVNLPAKVDLVHTKLRGVLRVSGHLHPIAKKGAKTTDRHLRKSETKTYAVLTSQASAKLAKTA
jgi:hypothetical protein